MTRAPLTLLLLPAILAAVLGLAPPRAAAQVLVAGSPTPAARVLSAWLAAHLPARYAAHGRFEVHLLSDPEMDAYLKAGDPEADPAPDDPAQAAPQNAHGDDGEIDGVFEDDPARITLRVPAAGLPDMYTFAHEYGHYVWFNLLTRDDRRRYEGVYRRQKAAHRLVTRYARTDAEEGFAEAFSFYANEPPLLLHRDPLSFQFLSQWPIPSPGLAPVRGSLP